MSGHADDPRLTAYALDAMTASEALAFQAELSREDGGVPYRATSPMRDVEAIRDVAEVTAELFALQAPGKLSREQRARIEGALEYRRLEPAAVEALEEPPIRRRSAVAMAVGLLVAAMAVMVGAGFFSGGSVAVRPPLRAETIVPSTPYASLHVRAPGQRGLKLTVDGTPRGRLPVDVEGLQPGRHLIEVGGSSAYERHVQEIELERGDSRHLDLRLPVVKGLAKIELGSGASGAKVYLVRGGERRRLTKFPIKLSLENDDRTSLVATKTGYSKFEQALAFEPGGAERTFVVQLEETERPVVASASPPVAMRRLTAPAPPPRAAGGNATVNVNSIPVAHVILNGHPLGTTPKTGVSVPAGPVTAIFVHPEHGRKVRTTTVQPGGTATLVVRFP